MKEYYIYKIGGVSLLLIKEMVVINYAKLRKYDANNFSGINSTLFVSGCYHNCEGCFNKEAQDFNYGKPFTKEVEDLFLSYIKDENVKGVNLLGGEPFQQDLNTIYNLVKRITKETGKPIYCWTGYRWSEIVQDEKKVEILKYITVLIDGRFEIDKRDLTLKHKGSWNQKEIDVQKSLVKGEIILYKN